MGSKKYLISQGKNDEDWKSNVYRDEACVVKRHQGRVSRRCLPGTATRRRQDTALPEMEHGLDVDHARRDDATGSRHGPRTAQRHLSQERPEDGHPHHAQREQRTRETRPRGPGKNG